VSDLPKLPNCSDVSTGELVELGKSDTFPILFGFEVDEKLLRSPSKSSATSAGSDIPHGDRLYRRGRCLPQARRYQRGEQERNKNQES